MSSKKKLDVKALLDKAKGWLQVLRRYSFVIFLIFITVLYGFVLLRVNTLNSAQPSSDAVSSQVKAAQIPRINPTLLNQLRSLQDNSVNVKALFNQARNDPFQ